MQLSNNYLTMLRNTFGEHKLQEILEAYDFPPVRGLRKNTYKPCDLPFTGQSSPLNHELLIPDDYPKTVTHPLHHAGCYYIQDPSATIPVQALSPEATDIVVDLCAAPGGKTTQILNSIPHGFLIANEIDSKRNQKLVSNLDRWGNENVVVTQSDTTKLAKAFPSTFDKVLLDAPCSGEGLFRRTPEFAKEYNPNTAHQLAKLQIELLEDAYTLAKAKGVIVYSTCTLNRTENEDVVKAFLEAHPDVACIDFTMEHGTVGFDGIGLRFFPSQHGEGHFIAKLQVNKQTDDNELSFKDYHEEAFEGFSAHIRKHNDQVYALKHRGPLKTALQVTKDGIYVGSYKRNRFEYDHAFSQSCAFNNVFPSIDVTLEEAYRYLYGHPLANKVSGLHCVKYNGYSLGFVKGAQTHANNRYPKGLRNKFDHY